MASKDILYTDRPEPAREEQAEISRRLNILRELTRNRRIARETRVTVRVEYFRPCRDENSPAYGHGGQCLTVRGICRRVDADVSRSVTVGREDIPLDDIISIDAPGIFDRGWETDAP